MFNEGDYVHYFLKNYLQFPDSEFDLFVDVGLSHNAPHSKQVLASNSKSFVIGVEPNPENCQSIRGLNLGDRFCLIEAGASNFSEVTTLNMMSPDPGTSSFLPVTEVLLNRGYRISGKVAVPCVRLDSILDLVPWNNVNKGMFSMKSDTQGYELKVLGGLGAYIEKITKLKIECTCWGQYENASTLEEIRTILSPYFDFTKEEHENAWFTKK